MLEARSLTKYYSAVPAIRDLSFSLVPGGILGLLGPNGSGKSTTVSILTGLLEPSGGTVLLNGHPVRDDLLAYKSRIGYVPEEAVLYTYLTGPEYLSLVGGLRGIPQKRLQEKIDGLLTLFGLQDAVHAPMSAYSKAEDSDLGGAAPRSRNHHSRRAQFRARRHDRARPPPAGAAARC
jgi:ABC-2 type transport system ATP-binding protein